MLVSMTGYGAGHFESEDIRVKVEMRGVNHRFFEPVIRLPKGFLALEEPIRNEVATKVHRGRLEIFVVIEDFGLRGRTVTLDSQLLSAYHAAFSEARNIAPIEGDIQASTLFSLPDVFSVKEEDPDVSQIWAYVSKALGQALTTLIAMRQAEGQRLQMDILHRLQAFHDRIEAIAQRAPSVVEAYRNRLTERLQEWHETVTLNEERLHTEVALMAERSDITEELVRARSHVEAFRTTCNEGGAVGRKLDFLLQEMHREVTTIGSKASDVQISRHVVDIKAELEKIREQVQNIE